MRNAKIDSLIIKILVYEKNVDVLKSQEGESVKTLGEINRNFRVINEKLKNNQEALKYTTKVYVISNLKYPSNISYKTNKENAFKINFSDLRTIYNEELPKFKSKPIIILQGKAAQFDIVDLTKEYVKIEIAWTTQRINPNYSEQEFYNFDMWVAEPN